MSDHPQNGWEPDPRKMGNWRAMFEQPRAQATGHAPPPRLDDAGADEPVAHDLTSYRPWLLQRGRSRPALMLGLRRFDPRSGQWIGWGLSYPALHMVEYTGDRLVSLDFGSRQFVIEGRGLDELAQRIKQGTVLTILEYAASVWPDAPQGPVVTAIRRVGQEGFPIDR